MANRFVKRLAIACVAATGFAALVACTRDTTYFTHGTVTELEPFGDHDIVTVETHTGELYEFEGWDFELGESVGLMMDDNNTTTPKDDKIYDAWKE